MDPEGRGDWWNRVRYRAYAPVYDRLTGPLERGRKRAIDRLDPRDGERILLLGCGTGRDLDHLPAGVDVSAIDVTPAMVRRTEARAADRGLSIDARVADARSLPFDDDTFDAVVCHLVLAVVPDPETVLAETVRVLESNGRVSIFDKFLPAGEDPSIPRRLLNPIARVAFSDLNRQLDPMLDGAGLALHGERESVVGGLYTVAIARALSGD